MVNWKLKSKIIGKFGSQADFAQAVGNREAVVSRVVRGRQKLSVDTQAKWAEALDTTIEEIFG